MLSSNKLKIRNSILYNKYINRDIKILCFSDVHLSKLVGMNTVNKIISAIKLEKPDYICFVGDMVDNPKYYNEFKHDEVIKLISECANIGKTIYIIGNHDYIDEDYKLNKNIFNNIKIFDELNKINNVKVLVDDIFEDDNIYIYGYMQKYECYCNNKFEDDKLFSDDLSKHIINSNNNKFKLFLTHSPEPINNNTIKILDNFDLIVTGHYHNGCTPAILDNILPGNMGIVSPKVRLFPKYARGIRKFKNNYLIFGGGWTKIHDCSPKFIHPLDKLCNRQMDVITITNNNKYSELKTSNKYINLKNL